MLASTLMLSVSHPPPSPPLMEEVQEKEDRSSPSACCNPKCQAIYISAEESTSNDVGNVANTPLGYAIADGAICYAYRFNDLSFEILYMLHG